MWRFIRRRNISLLPSRLPFGNRRSLQGLSRHSLARELTAHTPTKSN
jgi:hypothetical protein